MTYLQGSSPEYGEACVLEKDDYIVLVYNMHP